MLRLATILALAALLVAAGCTDDGANPCPNTEPADCTDETPHLEYGDCQCVECIDHDDCDAEAAYCRPATNNCVDHGCDQLGPDDCTGETGIFDSDTCRCVECLADYDCTDDECIAGLCQSEGDCQTDEDCPDDLDCHPLDEVCVDLDDPVECATDEDCPDGPCEDGTCRTVQTQDECQQDADCDPGTVCSDDNRCLEKDCDECTGDQICLVTADNPDGSCSAPECDTTDDCEEPGEICEDGICVEPPDGGG